MNQIRKLLPGVLVAIWVFAVIAVGQSSQQPASQAGGASSETAEAKTPSKSSVDQSQQPPKNISKPNYKSGASQTSAGSTQAAASQAKDDTQTSDSDDKEDAPRHRSHIHLGTIGFGVGYTRFPASFLPYYGFGSYPYGFGPYAFGPFYSPLAYGYYDPFYGPYYSGMFAGNLGYGADKGEIKLSTSGKGAQVYLNGAFAGPADKLKSMWLEPGAYDLSVSAPGRQKFEQRFYVISGKSLKIKAQLNAQ